MKRKAKAKAASVDAIIEGIVDSLAKAQDEFHRILMLVKQLLDLRAAKTTGNPAKPEKRDNAAPKKPVKRAKAARQVKQDKQGKPATPPAASAVPTVVATPPATPPARHRTPASVRLTPHEVTLNIGSQPVKELAEQDAKDLLNNPKVFWYRPMQFPDPRRYQVQPRIEGARVVKRNDPKFTRAPWTVSVTVALVGDDKRCDSWGVAAFNKNKADQE